jgi:hypothetical protein
MEVMKLRSQIRKIVIAVDNLRRFYAERNKSELGVAIIKELDEQLIRILGIDPKTGGINGPV